MKTKWPKSGSDARRGGGWILSEHTASLALLPSLQVLCETQEVSFTPCGTLAQALVCYGPWECNVGPDLSVSAGHLHSSALCTRGPYDVRFVFEGSTWTLDGRKPEWTISCFSPETFRASVCAPPPQQSHPRAPRGIHTWACHWFYFTCTWPA